jgi:hypothetical protein
LPRKIEPSWTFKYNAGANPIAFNIPRQHIDHSKIIEILTKAYGLSRAGPQDSVHEEPGH